MWNGWYEKEKCVIGRGVGDKENNGWYGRKEMVEWVGGKRNGWFGIVRQKGGMTGRKWRNGFITCRCCIVTQCLM